MMTTTHQGFDTLSHEFIILLSDDREDMIENIINYLKDKKYLTKSDIFFSHKTHNLHVKYEGWNKLSLDDRKHIRAFVEGYVLGYGDGHDFAVLEDADIISID